jgi:hypothetical protein
MTSRILAMALALVAALATWAAGADSSARDAPREIEHLLRYLVESKCAFNRNGTWYGAPAARAHLEEKYQYLKRRSAVVTAEDFLAHAATASSISGRAYQVRCEGKDPVATAAWLEAELRRYRAAGGGAGK